MCEAESFSAYLIFLASHSFFARNSRIRIRSVVERAYSIFFGVVGFLLRFSFKWLLQPPLACTSQRYTVVLCTPTISAVFFTDPVILKERMISFGFFRILILFHMSCISYVTLRSYYFVVSRTFNSSDFSICYFFGAMAEKRSSGG